MVVSSQNIPQTGVMADAVGNYEQATIDSLRIKVSVYLASIKPDSHIISNINITNHGY
ncbi:hypothetical protein [Nostoc sp.]|uniref:hypothetical protein n=1 Tax=Nostoc sp. TaxID=1180 RepID=UPI002FF63332